MQKFFAFCLLSSYKTPENIGTKAELNAPSAKILLNKFGILNAIKKQSENFPAPRYFATNKSRKRPLTLLIKVINPTTIVFLNKL